jgi:hypothetical protein
MKPDTKIADKAIAYLKKEAMTRAQQGLTVQAKRIGEIMNACGVNDNYRARDKIYVSFVASLNHAVELGVLSSRKSWGNTKVFEYCGPDIEKLLNGFKNAKEEEKAKLLKVIKHNRLKNVTVSEIYSSRATKGNTWEVTMRADAFFKLIHRCPIRRY